MRLLGLGIAVLFATFFPWSIVGWSPGKAFATAISAPPIFSINSWVHFAVNVAIGFAIAIATLRVLGVGDHAASITRGPKWIKRGLYLLLAYILLTPVVILSSSSYRLDRPPEWFGFLLLVPVVVITVGVTQGLFFEWRTALLKGRSTVEKNDQNA